MDERALADRLPQEEVLTRVGVRIALVHGHGVGRASIDDLAKRFGDRGVDLVVWGHIHEPVSEIRDGVRYFNPGTAGGIGSPPTCGVLSIDSGNITLELLALGRTC